MADVSKTGFTNAAYQVCYSIRADDARTELAQACESGADFQQTKSAAVNKGFLQGLQLMQQSNTRHLNMEYFIPSRTASITAAPGEIKNYGEALQNFKNEAFNVFKEMGYISSIDQLTCSISATLGEPYPVASCKTQPIFEGD